MSADKYPCIFSRQMDTIVYNYHVKFTCYCILTECSRPIRCFKVVLMHNNNNYLYYMAGSASGQDEANPVF